VGSLVAAHSAGHPSVALDPSLSVAGLLRRAWFASFGTSLHDRIPSLDSYFCMSVDAAAGGCALLNARSSLREHVRRIGH